MRWSERWNGCTPLRVLYVAFVVALALPNGVLCFTEYTGSVWPCVCNLLLPVAFYMGVSAVSSKLGRTIWCLFPFVFLAAFQLVLLYLFGSSIIAVDMFLNLVTTNPGEAMELLDNLVPAVAGVFVVYLPILGLAAVAWARGRELDHAFLCRQRKWAAVAMVCGSMCTWACSWAEPDYRIKTDLYPVNVCYNLYLAVERAGQTAAYAETSKDFTFQAQSTHTAQQAEVYVLVIGETARACHWGLYGYGRPTTPLLAATEGLLAFPDVLTQSNTTHKSVPMLLSAVTADDYDRIYFQKGLLTAFREAGFHTAFFSNQLPNHSFIDFFGAEAHDCRFVRQQAAVGPTPPLDDELLTLVQQKLHEGHRKLLVVLHTYGSHFNYRERYPAAQAFFRPDSLTDARPENRTCLVNAYDNTIRYTDRFLVALITALRRQGVASALLYTSDHGEDIFDDDRRLFLHASPVPSYYQLHVPFLVWTSSDYRTAFPDVVEALQANRTLPVASNATVFPTMLQLAGITSPYRVDSLSVASRRFRPSPRHYLNDHNLPRPLDKIGLKEEDIRLFQQWGVQYP